MNQYDRRKTINKLRQLKNLHKYQLQLKLLLIIMFFVNCVSEMGVNVKIVEWA